MTLVFTPASLSTYDVCSFCRICLKPPVNNDLRKNGFEALYSETLASDVINLRLRFEAVYRSLFTENAGRNRNLVKRFAQDPLVSRFFSSDALMELVTSAAAIESVVQTGPVVTHYTSGDITGQGYGLGYHQDWPSMGTSSKGIVCWVTLYDTIDSHSMKVMPGSHSAGCLPGQQTEIGYVVDVSELDAPEVLEVKAGSVVLFSPWLVHATHLQSGVAGSEYKLALSTRFDDLNCEEWGGRNYVSAYFSAVDRDVWKA